MRKIAILVLALGLSGCASFDHGKPVVQAKPQIVNTAAKSDKVVTVVAPSVPANQVVNERWITKYKAKVKAYIAKKKWLHK